MEKWKKKILHCYNILQNYPLDFNSYASASTLEIFCLAPAAG